MPWVSHFLINSHTKPCSHLAWVYLMLFPPGAHPVTTPFKVHSVPKQRQYSDIFIFVGRFDLAWQLSPREQHEMFTWVRLLYWMIRFQLLWLLNTPGGSDGQESACNAGDPGSIPGSGRAPGEGNGSPLQYSCLENPMDRGAWWLQSIRLQRVGHDWNDLECTHAHQPYTRCFSLIISAKVLLEFCLILCCRGERESCSVALWLFANPWTIQSMEFSRPGYLVGSFSRAVFYFAIISRNRIVTGSLVSCLKIDSMLGRHMSTCRFRFNAIKYSF